MREFPFPDRRNGVTICVVTDTHFGYQDWTNEWLEQVGKDIDELAPYVDGYVHAGDLINWRGSNPNDEDFNAWLADRKAATSHPWIYVAGNHDLTTYDSTPYSRTDNAWASAVGLSSVDNTAIMGGLKVIGLSPEEWPPTYSSSVLTSAKINWLDAELTSAGDTPCWIVCHDTPAEHAYGEFAPMSAPGLDTMLASHNNVIGWISGHNHHNIDTEGTGNTKVLNYGSNSLFSINCPPSGGRNSTVSGIHWDETAMTTFITYRDNRIEIRWRDSLRGIWEFAGDERVRVLTK